MYNHFFRVKAFIRKLSGKLLQLNFTDRFIACLTLPLEIYLLFCSAEISPLAAAALKYRRAVPIPVEKATNPQFIDLTSSPDQKYLAVQIQAKEGAFAILFDQNLQPFRNVKLPVGARALAAGKSSLYFIQRSSGDGSQLELRKLNLQSGEEKSVSLPSNIEKVLEAADQVFIVRHGGLHLVDFGNNSIKLSYRYSDSSSGDQWVFTTFGSKVLGANASTGIGFICAAESWSCSSEEFLSGEQKDSLSTKHVGESLFAGTGILAMPHNIYLVAGRFSLSEGFKLNQFSASGKFEATKLLASPPLSAIEPGEAKHKSLAPFRNLILSRHFAVVGAYIALVDPRTLSVVAY